MAEERVPKDLESATVMDAQSSRVWKLTIVA
jgi:hypothetical protein